MSDRAFLLALAAAQAFMGWRILATPEAERTIEFMGHGWFAGGFFAASLSVAVFAFHADSRPLRELSRPLRELSGVLTVTAFAGRAIATLFAGYWDEVIPLSRAQLGFAAWTSGALLATWVWARALPRRVG